MMVNIHKCYSGLHNISGDAFSNDKSAERELQEVTMDVHETKSTGADPLASASPSNVLPLFPAVYVKEELSNGAEYISPFYAPVSTAACKDEPQDGHNTSRSEVRSIKQEPASGPTHPVHAAETSYRHDVEMLTWAEVACKGEPGVSFTSLGGDRCNVEVCKKISSPDSSSGIHCPAPVLTSEAAINAACSDVLHGSVTSSLLDSEDQKPFHGIGSDSDTLIFGIRSNCKGFGNALVPCNTCEYSLEAPERTSSDAFLKSTSKRFQCSDCEYSTSHKGSLLRHALFKHSDVKPFQCSHCEYSSALRSNIWRHTMVKHSIIEPFQCFECEFSSDKINSLKLHTKEKHFSGKPFQCSQCDFWSINKTSLRRHILSKHSDERPFHCTHCKYSSAHKFHLKTHILINHSTVKAFQCDQCKRAFATKSLLKRHVMVKHSQLGPFHCSLCNYSTADKVDIDRHNDAKHSKAKPFKCTQCGYSSAYKCNLRSHIKAKHTKREDSDCV